MADGFSYFSLVVINYMFYNLSTLTFMNYSLLLPRQTTVPGGCVPQYGSGIMKILIR